jgi:hypothetical protein
MLSRCPRTEERQFSAAPSPLFARSLPSRPGAHGQETVALQTVAGHRETSQGAQLRQGWASGKTSPLMRHPSREPVLFSHASRAESLSPSRYPDRKISNLPARCEDGQLLREVEIRCAEGSANEGAKPLPGAPARSPPRPAKGLLRGESRREPGGAREHLNAAVSGSPLEDLHLFSRSSEASPVVPRGLVPFRNGPLMLIIWTGLPV